MVAHPPPHPSEQEAADLLAALRARKLKLATAESCTGGMIAAALTDIAGCSDVVERGFIVYSNASKTEILGVPADLLAAHGAVSEPAARAMVQGALARSRAQVAVAVTGVAGPTGGTAEKPVGLVHLAAARADGPVLHVRHVFPGDRAAVRAATVAEAFALIRRVAEAG
ncbi:MAG: CinA family protein [Alphaproteobacteria bacterium]|nr:CinA family protein [Alphaproteobacteria bacterium]